MPKVAPVEIVYGQLPGPTEEPISPALLAEITGMGYSTVTRHLRALAAAGRADQVNPIGRGQSVLWFRTDAGSTPKTPARQDRSRPTAAAQPDGPAPTAASVGDPPLADGADVDVEARRPGNAGGGPVDHAAPAPAAAPVTTPGAAAGVTPDHPQSRAGEPADAQPETETQATDPRPAPEADAEVRGSAEAGEPAGPAVVLPPPPAQPDLEIDVTEMGDDKWRAAALRGLDRVGLTFAQLAEQARGDRFQDLEAKKLWQVLRGVADSGEVYNPEDDTFVPDHPRVWVATQRRGIEFHRPAGDSGLNADALTVCRRSMRTGVQLWRGYAEGQMAGKPCPRCWPAEDPRPVSAAPASGGVADVAEWMQSARPAAPLPVPAAAPPDRLTEAEARALTDTIKARVTDLLPLIREAFQRRADLALGYPSWAAYCDAELRGLRMPLEERQQATAALHAEGMSTRAIAGALGTSDATVRRDLEAAGATDDAPERVVGLDGKRYASSRPTTAAEVGDLASADAGGEGLSSSSPAGAAAAPVAPAGAGATGVTRNLAAEVLAVLEGTGPYGLTLDEIRNLVPGPVDWADLEAVVDDLTAAKVLFTSTTPTAKRWIKSRTVTAAEGSRSPAPADGVDGPAGGGHGPSDSATTPAPSPAGPGGEGVTPSGDPFADHVVEVDPAEIAEDVDAFLRGSARLREQEEGRDAAVIEGVVVDDPGPLPEPPALDPALRDRIENALNQVEMHIGDLATWLYRAGAHGPAWVHAVRTQRHSLDQIIRRLDQVDG